MLRRLMMAGGGVADAMAAAILGHNPFLYFKLGEPSGSTALNDGSGPNGSYSGSFTLGNAVLRSGGDSSWSPTATSARAVFPNASIPSMPNGMTIGLVGRSANVSGQRIMLTRDNAGTGGGTRSFMFRLDSNNFQFWKIVGTAESITAPHGLSNGQDFFAAVTYDSITGATKIFKGQNQAGSTATFATGADFGGSGGSDIIVGNFFGFNQAPTGDMFSDAFVIDGCLTDSDIAVIAAAGGFA